MDEEQEEKVTELEVLTETWISVNASQCEENEVVVVVIKSVYNHFRVSCIGQRVVVETCLEEDGGVLSHREYRKKFDLRKISVMGAGEVHLESGLLNGRTTLKVFGDGGIRLENDEKFVMSRLSIQNHGSGKITGDGITAEFLGIISTGVGEISGFLVEDELKIVHTGSGTISLDKFATCKYVKSRGAACRGKITFRGKRKC